MYYVCKCKIDELYCAIELTSKEHSLTIVCTYSPMSLNQIIFSLLLMAIAWFCSCIFYKSSVNLGRNWDTDVEHVVKQCCSVTGPFTAGLLSYFLTYHRSQICNWLLIRTLELWDVLFIQIDKCIVGVPLPYCTDLCCCKAGLWSSLAAKVKKIISQFWKMSRLPPPPPGRLQHLWEESGHCRWRLLGRTIRCTCIVSVFVFTVFIVFTATYLVSKEIEIGEKNAKLGYYAVQGHPRSSRSVPIESRYATSY